MSGSHRDMKMEGYCSRIKELGNGHASLIWLATASTIARAISSKVKEDNVHLSDLVAIGCDDAITNVGLKGGVM